MLKADNLLPSCAVVTKSGNLNFLEPSGYLRACNGTALPTLNSEAAEAPEVLVPGCKSTCRPITIKFQKTRIQKRLHNTIVPTQSRIQAGTYKETNIIKTWTCAPVNTFAMGPTATRTGPDFSIPHLTLSHRRWLVTRRRPAARAIHARTRS